MLALTCLGLQSGLDSARLALDREDFYAAWSSINAEPDELLAWSGRAEILYRAGDPAGALAAARSGLGIDPGQVDLIYYAAGAALWLEDAPAAVDYSKRLLQAAETMDGNFPEKRRAWLDAAVDFSERSKVLQAHEIKLSRMTVNLRNLSIGGVAFWLLLVGSLLLGHGRSSKPVS